MRCVELFAGVGGFRLGLERNGHEVVWANEWDKYAADIYDKNFGGKINRESITDVRAEDIPTHDLICGGFPCQAFSVAGKRKGFDETRGTLFFDIMRIAQHHRTPYLFLENVKGLLSHDGGRTFETIIRTMDELGYDCQWQVLNSKNFGVPQNRERVFIIGHLRGQPRPEVFPIGETDNSDPQPEAGKRVRRQPGMHRLSSYLDGGGEHRGQTSSGDKPQEPVSNPGTIQRLDTDAPHYQDRVYSPEGLAPTLPTGTGGNQRNEVRKMPIAGTVPTAWSGKQYQRVNGIRRLTPLECERLQGFPDNWTEGASDTQRYKMMGNAVTVNVIEAIAGKLVEVVSASR